jgi:hypothetical protein
MKLKKRSLIVFSISLMLCLVCAGVSFFFSDTKEQFHQKAVPSPLLSYGETGKILRNLDAILPLEDKSTLEGFLPNAVDFAERAMRERKKWLLLEKYKKYADKGIYGYIEMQSEEPDIPFTVAIKSVGSWRSVVNSKVKADKITYPFFLDDNSPEIDIQLVFHNKLSALKITGLAFYQKGFHPLIYTDPIAFNSFLREGPEGTNHISSYGIEVPPSEKPAPLIGKAIFQKKTLAGMSKYQKKQGNSQIQLVAQKDHPLFKNLKISNSKLESISKSKISALAIDIDPIDLYSQPYGILTNFDEHGRRWERLSYIRFYRNGKNIFSNFTGIRLQGGDPGREKGLINFRLFFREEYGKSFIESNKLFDGKAGNIKRLAVKQSEWPKWPLNTPIAYDVSRQMGVLAPPTELVLLYLNGAELGLYYIVPHLGEKQVKSMLPDKDYNYYRIRGRQHDSDKYFMTNEFFKILYYDGIMSEEFAEQFFDLENLSRQIFSYIVNATGDFCQGLALKGEAPGSKMFWYSWDMDHSYVDFPHEIKELRSTTKERWEQTPDISLALYNEQPGGKKHYCSRLRLFRRLVNEDPVFREKTKHLFASIMNNQLTDEFITNLLNEYQQKLQAVSYPNGDEYIEILRDFFKHRKPFLLDQMQREFPAEPPVHCLVTADDYPIKVDGFIKEMPYEGNYFPGATLTLDSAGDNTVKYWIMNGNKVEGSSTSFPITTGGDCQIKAIH